MKKIIIATVLLAVVALKANSQNSAGNCYRGYVDAGYSIGIGDYCFNRFEINTSHGYQINPYIFIGAGFGFHFMPEYETDGSSNIALDIRDSEVDIPIFADVRINFMKSTFTPFVDVRGGTYVTNNGGLYVNAAVGCRYAINSKQGIYLAVGYAKGKLEFQEFAGYTSSSSGTYYRKAADGETESITIKLGFEF